MLVKVSIVDKDIWLNLGEIFCSSDEDKVITVHLLAKASRSLHMVDEGYQDHYL